MKSPSWFVVWSENEKMDTFFPEFTCLKYAPNLFQIRWSISRFFATAISFFPVSRSRILLKSRIAGSSHWHGKNMICCHGIELGNTYTRFHELCWDASVYSTVYHLFQHKMDKTEKKKTNKQRTYSESKWTSRESFNLPERRKKIILIILSPYRAFLG